MSEEYSPCGDCKTLGSCGDCIVEKGKVKLLKMTMEREELMGIVNRLVNHPFSEGDIALNSPLIMEAADLVIRIQR